MPRFTNEQYADEIPRCCVFQTIEAHESIMWCWRILDSLNGAGPIDCDGCKRNTMKVSHDDTPKQPDLI